MNTPFHSVRSWQRSTRQKCSATGRRQKSYDGKRDSLIRSFHHLNTSCESAQSTSGSSSSEGSFPYSFRYYNGVHPQDFCPLNNYISFPIYSTFSTGSLFPDFFIYCSYPTNYNLHLAFPLSFPTHSYYSNSSVPEDHFQATTFLLLSCY